MYEGYSAPTTGAELAAALAERQNKHEELLAEGEQKNYDAAEAAGLTPLQQKVVETHAAVFKEQVEGAYTLFGDRKDGGLVTLVLTHDLKDSFTHPMAAAYFREVLAWEAEKG